MQGWIGIDVSQLTLDACIVKSEGKHAHRQFKNEATGWAKLLRWAQSFQCAELHFCLESTGAYGKGLAQFLANDGQKVSVENPARIKHFGISQGVLNKTDKADAKVIADYTRASNPSPWRLSTPEVQLLVSLIRRSASLESLLIEEKNRLAQPGLPSEVIRSLKKTVRFLEQEIDRIKKQIQSHVDNHPDMKADQELLESIPGIGKDTALRILAEIGDIRQFKSGQSVAAYAGLSPRQYTSGTSVRGRTHITKAGNRRLRAALYMPAMSAVQHNSLVRALYQRLLGKGLSRMAALAAAMRKLLMIAYGVLKTRAKFNPTWSPSTS
jgi:transposase